MDKIEFSFGKLLLLLLFAVFLSGCRNLIIVSDKNNHRQIYKIYEYNISNYRNLSANAYPDQFPDVSPDGGKIVFSSIRSGTVENLFIMTISGSNSYQITYGSNKKVKPRWSPAHDRIAYAEYLASDKAIIYSISPNGGETTQITYPGSTQSDSGGHDFFDFGHKIVFSRHDNATFSYDLYWQPAHASGSSSLHALTSTTDLSETLPVISHNGQMLAFRAYSKVVLSTGATFTTDMIKIMNTRTWTPLHSFKLAKPVRNGTVAALEFSANDTSLYVAAQGMTESEPLNSCYEIYKVSLDGTAVDRLTSNNTEDTWPSAIPQRWVRMSPSPADLKQGDLVTLSIEAGEWEHIERVNYTVNGRSGTVTSLPYQFLFDTCKASGTYHSALSVWCDATYQDGERYQFSSNFDLTTGRATREDGDRTYAFYVARDADQDLEDRFISRANEFMDEFDTYTRSQYYYAEPWLFTNGAINYANSVDMVIAIGHGSHHYFGTGNGNVDLSDTSFGVFAPCYRSGDLEYLVLISCQTLSRDDFNGDPYWYYWRHRGDTQLENRPFTGLHMVLGFRTNVVFSHSLVDDDGGDFLCTFASNLDDGMAVREAWFDAANQDLDFGDGNNRLGVLFMEDDRDDYLGSCQYDYIFGSPRYILWKQFMD